MHSVRTCTEIVGSSETLRTIYCDDEIYEDFKEFLKDKAVNKKFQLIIKGLLERQAIGHLYAKEAINNSTKGVTAMKFKLSKSNDRLYCKEFETSNGGKAIVICQIHIGKKTTKLQHQERQLIEKTGSYTYEFP